LQRSIYRRRGGGGRQLKRISSSRYADQPDTRPRSRRRRLHRAGMAKEADQRDRGDAGYAMITRRPASASGQASKFSAQNILQHGLIEAQVSRRITSICRTWAEIQLFRKERTVMGREVAPVRWGMGQSCIDAHSADNCTANGSGYFVPPDNEQPPGNHETVPNAGPRRQPISRPRHAATTFGEACNGSGLRWVSRRRIFQS
jgi:hypothetical protein